MMKAILLTGAAMLIATPAAAQNMGTNMQSNVLYNNVLSTTIINNSTTNTNTSLNGNVTINGNIEIDSSAGAVVDGKQHINGNEVVFDNVDDDDDGNDANDSVVINTVNGFNVNANGNVGVNIASGQYNVQSNDAAISSSSSDNGSGDDGSWASASTTNWQRLNDTYYGGDGSSDSYADRNTATVGDVTGNGSIGVNAAAGAFNMQGNKMAIATAAETSLAKATSGSLQSVTANMIAVQDSQNISDIGTVSGSGNLHVNVAAGVGNLQSNSLSIASAR
jgi:hypothetical protein